MTPLERGDLGDEQICPYCEQPRALFALVYFHKSPVCADCAPILSARREAARKARMRPITMDELLAREQDGQGQARYEEILRRNPGRQYEGAGGLKHPEDRLVDPAEREVP